VVHAVVPWHRDYRGGASWSVIQLLVLATVISYAGAAWGLYKATARWKPVTIGASILGAVVLALWWIAASSIAGVTNLAANLALHAAGITVLLVVLLVPSLTRSLDRGLATHP
jgi:hypothetical protein